MQIFPPKVKRIEDLLPEGTGLIVEDGFAYWPPYKETITTLKWVKEPFKKYYFRLLNAYEKLEQRYHFVIGISAVLTGIIIVLLII